MTIIAILLGIVAIAFAYRASHMRIQRDIALGQMDRLRAQYETLQRENEIWRQMHPETEPQVRDMLTLPVYACSEKMPDPRDGLTEWGS